MAQTHTLSVHVKKTMRIDAKCASPPSSPCSLDNSEGIAMVQVQPASSSRRRRRNQDRSRTIEPILSFRAICGATAAFVAFVFLLIGISVMTADKGAIKAQSFTQNQVGRVFSRPEDIPSNLLHSFDAILILGGGVPASVDEPPVYVQRRCDDAVTVLQRRRNELKQLRDELPILCLSAGTAHMPQLLSSNDGLPVWESTSSAAYIQSKYSDIVDIDSVFVETTSYDTIGNAFYSRTSHTEIIGWRRLLIITNEVR